jgi:hypothetical protein
MQDELKRLTELDPAEETFKEELLKIRWEKISKIRHTIRGLLATQEAETAYEGEKEFASFLWEDIFPGTKMFNIQFEKFLLDPKVQKNLNLMASLQYTPPIQFRSVGVHLSELYAYYTKIIRDSEPLSLVEVVLDYSLCKLMFMAGMFYEHSLNKGHRELKRTIKSTKKKKEKTDNRKVFIIAIYEHGKAIEAETKFNMACTIIRKQFEDSRGSKGPWGTIPMDPKEMPTPSLDSIKRWLIEAGICDRDFKLEGRFWIKQT